jgi:TrmH family RNA methyltransferase
MQITSARNGRFQEIRKAARRGSPTEDGLVVAEGPHLLMEALESEWRVETVVVAAENVSKYGRLLARIPKENVIQTPADVFSVVSTTQTSQGILALLRPRAWSWNHLVNGTILLVVLDGVQDPGNAGTIVRSAEAFGATGAVFLRDTVHVANGKFLRATAGSIFRLPYLSNLTPSELSSFVVESRIHLYALASSSAISLMDANLQRPCALIVGSEGEGVSGEVLRSSDAISIPTERVESLNAAIACSIALFEARRQRGAR